MKKTIHIDTPGDYEIDFPEPPFFQRRFFLWEVFAGFGLLLILFGIVESCVASSAVSEQERLIKQINQDSYRLLQKR